MATQENTWNVSNRMHSSKDSDNPALDHIITGADEIYDDSKQKKQSDVNADVDAAIGSDTTPGSIKGRIKELEDEVGAGGSVDSRIATAKSEIIGDAASDYNTLGKLEDKIQAEASARQDAITAETNRATTRENQIYDLVHTPEQHYVTVATYADLANIASPSDDTVYRVSSYNGKTSQVDNTVYSEYGYDGTNFVFLCVKSQIDEVYDISAHHSNNTYVDLAAALDGGNNIPQELRRGGMSIKFVQSSDNKYAQWRLMNDQWSTTVSDWQSSNPSQERGQSTTVVMSQKSVTDELKNIDVFLNFTNSEQQTIVDLYTGKYINRGGTVVDNVSHMSVAEISLQKNEVIFVKGNFYGTFVPAIMEINSNGTWVKNIEFARSDKDELHIYIADKNIRLALNYVNNTGRPFEIYKGNGNGILYYLQKSLKSIDSIQPTLSSLAERLSRIEYVNNKDSIIDEPISSGNGFVDGYDGHVAVGSQVQFGTFGGHKKYLIPAEKRAYIKWTEHSGGGPGYGNVICDANDIVLEFIHNHGAPSTPTEYEHTFSKRDVDTYLYVTTGSEGPTEITLTEAEYINDAVKNLVNRVVTLQGNVSTLQGNVSTLQGSVSTLQGNVSMHDTLIGLFANNQFTKVDVSSLEVETGKYYNVHDSKESSANMSITTLPLLQGETAFIIADCYDSFVAAIKYGNKIVLARGNKSNLYIFTASSDIDIYISHQNTKPLEIYKGNGNGILYYLNQNIKGLSSIATVVSDLQSELADLRDFSTYANPQFISQGNGFVNWLTEPKIQVGQPINFGSFTTHSKYLIPAGTRAYIKWTEHSGGGPGYANAICDENDIVLEFVHNHGAPSTPTEYEHIFSKRDVDTYLYTTSGSSEGPTVTKIVIEEDIKEAIARQGEEISELEESVKIIDFSDKVVLIEGDSTSDEGGPNGTGHSWGYYMNLVLKFKRKINIAKSNGMCRDRTSSTSGVTKSPQWAPDAGNNFISYFGASDPYYPVQGSTESGTENYDQMTANNCLYSHTGYLFKLIQDGNIPTPDVYLMNLCGINDTWAGSSTTEAQIRAILGSVEDIIDIDDFETIQRNTIVNAITWSVQKIRKNYPSIQIIGITPVQQSKGNHNHFYLVYEELKKLFNYLSMPTIDVYGGCGIQKDLENNGSVAAGNIYTNDGTHPNGTGYTREGKFIASAIKSIVFI